MGMAASQARLLSLTARQHDVEYQAQAIQHAKIQLATQQDQVYAEYQAALDAQTMTLNTINTKTGATSLVAATFNNLFSSRRLTPATRTDVLNPSTYILLDRNGRLVVEDDIYEGYHNFTAENSGYPQTAQAFALYMLFGGNVDPSALIESQWNAYYEREWNGMNSGTRIMSDPYTSDQQENLRSIKKQILELMGLNIEDDYGPDHQWQTDSNGQPILDQNGDPIPVYPIDILDTSNIQDPDSFDWDKYDELLNQYFAILYSNGGANMIYRDIVGRNEGYENGYMDVPEDVQIDMNQFNYYMHIFRTIESCGGCVSIDDFNGFNGNAANDSEWLTNMISSGLMTVSTVSTDRETGELVFNATSPSSDDNLSYAATSSVDNAAVKKAEAKYEHDLKQIERKDKKFDLDLSKLETERNALKTEYESVKKVIQDNIERSFGIFS